MSGRDLRVQLRVWDRGHEVTALCPPCPQFPAHCPPGQTWQGGALVLHRLAPLSHPTSQGVPACRDGLTSNPTQPERRLAPKALVRDKGWWPGPSLSFDFTLWDVLPFTRRTRILLPGSAPTHSLPGRRGQAHL